MALRGPRVAHKGCLRCWAEVKTSLATCLAGTLPEPVHLHPPAPPLLATESSGLGKPAAVRLQALGPSCHSRAREPRFHRRFSLSLMLETRLPPTPSFIALAIHPRFTLPLGLEPGYPGFPAKSPSTSLCPNSRREQSRMPEWLPAARGEDAESTGNVKRRPRGGNGRLVSNERGPGAASDFRGPHDCTDIFGTVLLNGRSQKKCGAFYIQVFCLLLTEKELTDALPKSSRTSREWLLEKVEKTLLYELVRCGHFSSVFSRLLPCFHAQMLISVPNPFLLSKIRYL